MSASLKDRTIDLSAGVEVEETLIYDWLPLERWTPETLMSDIDSRTHKRYCTICDAWVNPWHATAHVEEHKAERVEFLARKREENKEHAAEARLAALKAKREERDRIKFGATMEDTVVEEFKAITQKPKRTRKPRKQIALTLPDGEFTVNQVAELNSTDRSETRNALVRMVASGDLIQAGVVKSGGRGRPAALFAKKNS